MKKTSNVQRPTSNVEVRGGKAPLDERLAKLTGRADGITFEESLQAVAAHLHRMGKTYIEIGLDPQTKEIGWSFVALLQDSKN